MGKAGGVEGGENVVGMYYMIEEYVFKTKKTEREQRHLLNKNIKKMTKEKWKMFNGSFPISFFLILTILLILIFLLINY